MHLPPLYNFAANLFARNADRASKITYVDDSGVTLSYAQLEQKARSFAQALQDSGARAEERVLIVLHDCCDWPVAFLRALYAGNVPVLANTLLDADGYADILAHCRPRAVVLGHALQIVFNQARLKTEYRPRNIWVSRDAHSGFAVSTQSHTMPDPYPTRADDAAFWLYSSGLNSAPKATVHSHASMRETAISYGASVVGIKDNDVCFSAPKLHSAFGLGNALTFPLWAGASALLMAEQPSPLAIFKQWLHPKCPPTLFFAQPRVYLGLLNSNQQPSALLLKLRLCASAGEPSPLMSGDLFKTIFGCDVLEGAGSNEMLHVFLSNTPSDVRYGTCGKAVPGCDLSLRLEDGTPAQPGQMGRLFVKSACSAMMYWADRANSQATFQGSWVDSGDLYTVDTQGYYSFCGHASDMLRINTQLIPPYDIEAVLKSHSEVLEAAVVGIEDTSGARSIKAYLVLKNQSANSIELTGSIKTRAKSLLNEASTPRTFIVVDALPKTPSGNIQRYKLRQLG